MARIQVRLADGEAESLDKLVDEAELFRTRTDAVRYAVRQMIKKQQVER